MDYIGILRNKKQRIRLAVILLLVLAIPLTMYLIRQQQILRSRAAGNPPMEFFDPPGAVGVVHDGTPPTTTSQTVQLKITYTR